MSGTCAAVGQRAGELHQRRTVSSETHARTRGSATYSSTRPGAGRSVSASAELLREELRTAAISGTLVALATTASPAASAAATWPAKMAQPEVRRLMQAQRPQWRAVSRGRDADCLAGVIAQDRLRDFADLYRRKTCLLRPPTRPTSPPLQLRVAAAR